MNLDYQLEGKVVLITGVSRRAGLGAALARGFVEAGSRVFTTYYRPYDRLMSYGSDEEEAAGLIAELGRGGSCAGVETDLSNPDAAAQVFEAAEAAVGGVDVLVNNATHDLKADIDGLTASLLDAHYAVNLRGTALLCTEFARRWRGTSGGRIVSLTSGQGLEPMPDSLPYVMTKAAVEALTRSMSVTLAAKGITANAVDPGATGYGLDIGGTARAAGLGVPEWAGRPAGRCRAADLVPRLRSGGLDHGADHTFQRGIVMNQKPSVIAAAAALALSLPVQAQLGGDTLSGSGVRLFLPVYSAYASALQKHGLAGFRGETTPVFTFHQECDSSGGPHPRKYWVGKAAISQIAPWLAGARGGKVAVTLCRLTLAGKRAVALTREEITFRPGYLDLGGHFTSASATSYWKQTWRQTGQGWRLADMEPISEEALGPPQKVTFTVTGDDTPARK